MSSVLILIAGVVLFVGTIVYVRSSLDCAATLSRFLVPAADDSRWTVTHDLARVTLTCGPYRIECSPRGYYLMYIGGEVITAACGGPAEDRFKQVAKNLRVPSALKLMRQDEKDKVKDALAIAAAWHKENEPKKLEPDTTLTQKGAFR